MSLHALLREATASDHVRLDGMFGGYDLADPVAYRGFLRAHARALQPIEAALAATFGMAGWQPRAALIAADLAALGEAPPPPLPLDPPAGARAWGMRYVVEGSRLGGTLLARQVGAGLPATYLGARHGKGEWRDFLAALDAEGAANGPEWRRDAIEGARAAFALFARSAGDEMAHDDRR